MPSVALGEHVLNAFFSSLFLNSFPICFGTLFPLLFLNAWYRREKDEHASDVFYHRRNCNAHHRVAANHCFLVLFCETSLSRSPCIQDVNCDCIAAYRVLLLLLITCIRLISSGVGSAGKCRVRQRHTHHLQ